MTTLEKRPTDDQLLASLVRQARLTHRVAGGHEATRDDERVALLSEPAIRGRVDRRRERLDRAVLASTAVLLPLQVLTLPVMSEGVDDPPGTPDTEGDISTQLLSPGGVDCEAALLQLPDRNPGGLPADRWWLHSWVDTATFPVAPETGRLYFQFTVDVDFQCLVPGADIRGVDAFITLRSENYLDVRWPLQIPQFTALEQSARTDLTGSIPVTAGQQINLGLTYGLVLFAGNGEFESQANFATHRTLPDQQLVPADYGVIEYRFVPQWWVTAVNRLTGLLTDQA
jgi:hypothetical protein